MSGSGLATERRDWNVVTFEGVPTLLAQRGSTEDAFLAKFMQHTGTGLSSRAAEDLLGRLEPGLEPFPEVSEPDGGQAVLEARLQEWFAPVVPTTFFPCNSGMNAFYAAFRAINTTQAAAGRRDWISVGWLYLDTTHILNLFLPEDARHHAFTDVADTAAIVDTIRSQGHRIAGLVLEAPTNPLLQTPDVSAIATACREAGILTVMDPSVTSPQNVDLSPWCDVIACSLTKYAAHSGDVMVGVAGICEVRCQKRRS
jgi:cystathionine gamma-synthase